MDERLLSTLYTNDVYAHMKPLYANWEPSAPIKLGDYGFMDGRRFERMGSIAEFGLDVGEVRVNRTGDQKSFSSDGKTDVSFHGKGAAKLGDAASGRAAVDISFSGQGASFFNLAGCSYETIEAKAALGNRIKATGDAWDRNWVVVTDLVRAASTTIAISAAANAKLVLEAAAETDEIDLADASIGLHRAKETGVGYRLIANAKAIPLLGFCALRRRFLVLGPNFRTFGDGQIEPWVKGGEGTGDDAEVDFVQLT